MDLKFTDEQAKEIREALTHSSQSTHHPKCSIKKTYHCSCHVVKAANALGTFNAAVANSQN